jgi:SAM-dependent methyltransferase
LVFGEFQRIAANQKIAGRVLEVGALGGKESLLAMEELSGCDRVGINLEPPSEYAGIKILQMNGNDMRAFEDNHFDAVLSNATLEHDALFWLTCAEMRRVLKSGGIAIIGVPGFTQEADVRRLGLPIHGNSPAEDYENATLTFRYHGAPPRATEGMFDYYRFSRRAIREVFFEGYREVEIFSVMTPPRLIARGRKI